MFLNCDLPDYVAPSTGAVSETKAHGGETLSAAAYLEVYRSQSALQPRPKGGIVKRLAKAVASALRSGRSS